MRLLQLGHSSTSQRQAPCDELHWARLIRKGPVTLGSCRLPLASMDLRLQTAKELAIRSKDSGTVVRIGVPEPRSQGRILNGLEKRRRSESWRGSLVPDRAVQEAGIRHHARGAASRMLVMSGCGGLVRWMLGPKPGSRRWRLGQRTRNASMRKGLQVRPLRCLDDKKEGCTKLSTGGGRVASSEQ
jgi:hypothetical protein